MPDVLLPPGACDDRPASSSSCHSSSSRIPRLARSSSLRGPRPAGRVEGHRRTGSSSSGHEASQPPRLKHDAPDAAAVASLPREMVERPAALFRSASFISSRGSNGLLSPSPHSSLSPVSPHSPASPQSFLSLPYTPQYGSRPRHSARPLSSPMTPELPRRRFSYVSPYSASYIAAERRAKMDATSSNDAPHDLDDCESVNSLDSCSLGSCLSSCDGASARCDVTSGRRQVSGVVHCGHHHDTPSFYLTPTQRAARTIRALRSRLATTERELAAKTSEVAALNRQLVELRLSGAGDATQGSEEARPHQQAAAPTGPSAPPANGDTATSAGGAVPPCVSPSDDSSESELRALCRDRQLTGGAGPMPKSGSPASVSLADTTDSAELNRSLADSGHYDDLTSPATSARDSFENSSALDKNSSAKQSIGSPGVVARADGEARTAATPSAGERGSALHSDDDRGRAVSETDDEMDDDEDEEEEAEDELDEEEDEEEEEEEEEWRARIEAEVDARLRVEHEKAMERLKQEHMNEFHEIKERHNDKVETLLSKLSDANLRYFELRPQLDRCQARVQQLETELERAKDDLAESERRHQNTYLQMFLKGQEAARLQHESECTSSGSGSRDGLPPPEGGELCEGGVRGPEGTVKGLMRELAHTQDELRKLKQAQKAEASKAAAAEPLDAARSNIDPGVTLQFLKSAVYYFLTDKDNAKGHLRAIVSILGFNEAEKYAIVQMVKV